MDRGEDFVIMFVLVWRFVPDLSQGVSRCTSLRWIEVFLYRLRDWKGASVKIENELM